MFEFIATSQPYANRIAQYLKDAHPTVPVVYFANGGSCFLHEQTDMVVDALSVDWRVSMQHARSVVGDKKVLQGNIDPMVLYGSEANIRRAVRECIDQSGTGGLVVNLGHGVEKDTPVEAVQILVDEVKQYKIDKTI